MAGLRDLLVNAIPESVPGWSDKGVAALNAARGALTPQGMPANTQMAGVGDLSGLTDALGSVAGRVKRAYGAFTTSPDNPTLTVNSATPANGGTPNAATPGGTIRPVETVRAAPVTPGGVGQTIGETARKAVDATGGVVNSVKQGAADLVGGVKAGFSPPPAADIGDTIASAAKDSGLREAEVLPQSVKGEMTPLGQTVSQVGAETNAMGGTKTATGGVVPPEASAGKFGPSGEALPGGEPTWMDKKIAGAKQAMADQAGVKIAGAKEAAETAKKISMSGLRSVSGVGMAIGKRLPGLAQAYEVADTASKAFSPEGEKEPLWKHGARMVGNMAGIGVGGTIGGILGAPLGPAGVVGGGVAGGAAGYEGMHKLTDWAFGPEPGTGIIDRIRGAQATPGAPAQPPAGPPPGTVTGTIPGPNDNQPPSRPGDTPGTGFVRNNQTGATQQFDQYSQFGDGRNALGDSRLPPNATPAQANEWIRNHNVLAQIQQGQRGPGGYFSENGAGMRGGAQPGGGGVNEFDDQTMSNLGNLAKTGPTGAMAALGLKAGYQRQRMNTMNMGFRGMQIQSTHDLAMANLQHQYANEARQQANEDRRFGTEREDNAAKVNNEAIGSFVKSTEEPMKTSTFVKSGDKEEYENRIGKKQSQVTDDINYSLGLRKTRLGQIDGNHLQYLLDADKLKTRLQNSRSDIMNKLYNYSGNKQWNSRDLYSYMFTGAEPSVDGYRMTMGNGNTVQVYRAQGKDGQWNLTGPNDPSDADVNKYIAPFIDKLRKQGK